MGRPLAEPLSERVVIGQPKLFIFYFYSVVRPWCFLHSFVRARGATKSRGASARARDAGVRSSRSVLRAPDEELTRRKWPRRRTKPRRRRPRSRSMARSRRSSTRCASRGRVVAVAAPSLSSPAVRDVADTLPAAPLATQVRLYNTITDRATRRVRVRPPRRERFEPRRGSGLELNYRPAARASDRAR